MLHFPVSHLAGNAQWAGEELCAPWVQLVKMCASRSDHYGVKTRQGILMDTRMCHSDKKFSPLPLCRISNVSKHTFNWRTSAINHKQEILPHTLLQNTCVLGKNQQASRKHMNWNVLKIYLSNLQGPILVSQNWFHCTICLGKVSRIAFLLLGTQVPIALTSPKLKPGCVTHWANP